MMTKEKDISIQIQEGLNANAQNYTYQLYRYMIKPYCGKHVLEVGCSIGNITNHLLKEKRTVVGVDVVKDSIRTINKTYAKNKRFHGYVIDGSSPTAFKKYKNTFDTVVCFNVLEHIKNDQRTLNNFYDVLKINGQLLLLVPAVPFLYGTVDKSDHHFRRYMKRDLKKKLLQSGFTIVSMRYSNFPGMFGWYLNGKILKKKMVDSSMLGFYDKLVPAIFKVESIIHPPIGLSLMCVCKK